MRPRRYYLDCLGFLQELVDEGLIRHLGVTNFDTAHLRVAVKSGIKIVSNQVQRMSARACLAARAHEHTSTRAHEHEHMHMHTSISTESQHLCFFGTWRLASLCAMRTLCGPCATTSCPPPPPHTHTPTTTTPTHPSWRVLTAAAPRACCRRTAGTRNASLERAPSASSSRTLVVLVVLVVPVVVPVAVPVVVPVVAPRHGAPLPPCSRSSCTSTHAASFTVHSMGAYLECVCLPPRGSGAHSQLIKQWV